MSTTFSDKSTFAQYLKSIRENEGFYSQKSSAEKGSFFQKMADFFLPSVGLPQAKVNVVTNLESTTIGVFDIAKNQILLNSQRLNIKTIEEFHRAAAVFYHEMRHAEQAFRGLQYYFSFPNSQEVRNANSKPSSKAVVVSNINLTLAGIAKTSALPIDRKEFARKMFVEYITKYSSDGEVYPSTAYERQPIERDGLLFQREAYKALGRDPNTWYPLAFGLARPAVSTDPSTFQISISPDGKTVKIDGNTVNIPSIPIKGLNRRADATVGADILGGDVVLVAGLPTTQASDDFIEGLDGNDNIFGVEGDDYLYGNAGNDTIRGGNGNDFLSGDEGNDSLVGDNGDDILDGGLGNDTLNGGDGNDTYYIDNVSDLIQGELPNGGQDLVYSSISINLGNYLEDLTLTGEGNITGAGNSLNNRLIGNNKVNILNGLAGDDRIYGLDGNDTLKGGDGDDYLDGDNNPLIGEGDAAPSIYVGGDRMEGGTGNDTYVINSSSDVVVENVAEGNDTVISELSYNLGANLENLILTGSGNTTGAGNSLDNTITGNDQVNILNGLAGNDTIYGGSGNDQLIGGQGNDILDGGEGDDTLLGGSGINLFVLGSIDPLLSPYGFDTLRDFQTGIDKIQLQHDSFIALTTAVGSQLKTNEFAKVTDDAAAANSSGLIVYSQASGRIFYNSNGAASGYGDGGELAILSERPANFGVSDILVI